MHAKGDAFFSPLPSVGGMSSSSPLQEGAGEDEGDSSGLCGEAVLDYLLEDLLEDLEDRMPTIDTGQAQAIGGSQFADPGPSSCVAHVVGGRTRSSMSLVLTSECYSVEAAAEPVPMPQTSGEIAPAAPQEDFLHSLD